ncbi:MAG: LapA family protein [Betaproteobacteria bacterium]|nr:LapA family protein [Betaproteobacteria bacterium]
MQLGLIVGIAFAIGAVLFALQNVAPVTVTLAFWSFEGSLALVLLLTLGLGALIAGLVSSPAMVRRQWSIARLGRKVADLEKKLAEQTRRNEELAASASALASVEWQYGAGGGIRGRPLSWPARPGVRRRGRTVAGPGRRRHDAPPVAGAPSPGCLHRLPCPVGHCHSRISGMSSPCARM